MSSSERPAPLRSSLRANPAPSADDSLPLPEVSITVPRRGKVRVVCGSGKKRKKEILTSNSCGSAACYSQKLLPYCQLSIPRPTLLMPAANRKVNHAHVQHLTNPQLRVRKTSRVNALVFQIKSLSVPLQNQAKHLLLVLLFSSTGLQRPMLAEPSNTTLHISEIRKLHLLATLIRYL